MAGYNLKSADEVQEYLKNLLIEYQFGCLSEKNPEICHLLADYKESITQDYKEATKLYKKNCDEYNFGRSCTKYGDYRALGRECERNVTEAFKYMRKGCDNNDSLGCLHAGALAVTDEKVEPERGNQISLGIQMLKKACDLNQEKGCFYLSSIFINGIEGFVEKNIKEAYVLSLKSCELGNPYACANVSVMHKKGDGVQQNMDLAKTFKDRANNLLKEMREYKPQLKFHQGIDP